MSVLGGALAATGGVSAPDAGVIAFFVVGLFGGAHCLGMCGPLVTMYADRIGDDERGPSTRALRQHALFNAGRTVSYAAIGALMGAVGAVLVDAGALLEAGDLVRGVAGVVAGVVIVASGVGYVTGGRSRLAAGAVPGLGPAFAAAAAARADRVDDSATGPRVVAPRAAHRILFAYGTAVDAVSATTRRRVHRGLGVAFLVAGTIPLAKGLTTLGYPVPHLPLPMPPMPG